MKYYGSLFLLVLVGYVSDSNALRVRRQFGGVSGPLVTFLGQYDRYEKARLIEHPASGKCMNVERAMVGSGIKIIMYDCNWRGYFTPVNELFYAVDAHGAFLLKGSASYSNMCLYTGNNHEDPLYTIKCNTDDNRQQFEFRRVGGDEYQLVQRATQRCLRAYGHNNGATIRATNCDHNDRDQKWRVCNADRKCNL